MDGRVAPRRRTDAACVEQERSVLVVDDEPSVRNVMRRWLESRGYAVTVAGDADEALQCLAQAPAAVVVCDLRMPGQGGLWLTDLLRREFPDIAVVIATGVNDVAAAVEGLRQGVVDYLTKPFDRERLFDAVARAVDWHRTAADVRAWRESLEAEMRGRESQLAAVLESWHVDSDKTLDGLLATLTAATPDGYGHAYRVAALAASLADALDLPPADVAVVERGALLHDIGKLAMPEAVLRKPAPLTAEERRIIRLHPAVGARLIQQMPYLAPAAAIVRDSQERPDGLGYPAGLRGDDVSLPARIVCVADAYDTMTHARVFRDACSPEAAIVELTRHRGSQFDARVVDALTALIGT
jgi:putative nucleotidyltransferase with HDIG domain